MASLYLLHLSLCRSESSQQWCSDSSDAHQCRHELPLPLRHERSTERPGFAQDTVLLQTRSEDAAAASAFAQRGKQALQGPPLCDPTLVAETCHKLGGSTQRPFVAWAVLSDIFAASSLNAAQAALGFPQDQTDVDCHELCTSAIQYLRKAGGVLPPCSDVACRTVGGNTTCDVDVEPEKLKRKLGKIANAELPDEGPQIVPVKTENGSVDNASLVMLSVGEHSSGGFGNLLGDAAGSQAAARGKRSLERKRWNPISDTDSLDYSVPEAVERIANLYRIHPSARQDISVSRPKAALLQEVAGNQERSVAGQIDGVIATRQAQARAWLAIVLREFAGRRTGTYRQKWFGGAGGLSAEQVRSRVLRTMNFVEEELSQGMRYVYPANNYPGACGSTIVAYIWRYGAADGGNDRGYLETKGPVCKGSDDPFRTPCGKDEQGRHFVYLCRRWYENNGETFQIATLVHEAAHHAGPTDITYIPDEMKRRSQADQLNNAASYQNFAQDLAQSAPPAPPTPPAAQPCADTYGSCQYYKDQGYCGTENIQRQCRRTCGLCSSPRPVPSPVPSPVPQPGCADTYGSCQYYKDNGFCGRSDAENIRKQCMKTCGLCGSQPAPRPANCVDDYGSCQYYKDEGFCSNDGVRRQCMRTCGAC